MDLDVKSLSSMLVYPFVALAGWHYNYVANKLSKSESAINELEIAKSRDGLRLDYLDEKVDKLENKMDNIISLLDEKVDTILEKLNV